MKAKPEVLDCAIIGAGPAGLTAAIYLARFRRRLVVFENADSRASWIPLTHNYPGFPEGVSGRDLLARMRLQAVSYGAEILRATVRSLSKIRNKNFCVSIDGADLPARFALIATGVVDNRPDIPNIRNVLENGHLRICPVCDGYEVIGKHVYIYGPFRKALEEAVLLRGFARKLTILLTEETELSREDLQLTSRLKIACADSPVATLEVKGDDIVAVTANGQRYDVEVLYPALGAKVRSDLAGALGAKLDESQYIITDAHLQTSIDGLYAAGDVVNELNGLSVCVGHAAIAATAIHRRLSKERRLLFPDGTPIGAGLPQMSARAMAPLASPLPR
ncbi:MAG TPA: NAD(P)/FAD-dependent oxidoreductase [Methylocella sp.]|nr:NAD(P)/FAD-dependent oxidoreductase [Methylocella sp.]